MVKILPTLITVSLSLSVVFAHGLQDLKKRAGLVCPTAYAPLAPGAYPALDCTPFVQDPQVQAWLKLVDFTKTPVYPPSVKGECPTDVASIPKDRCWWTCQKCEAPDDVTFCPKAGTWGLTYDGTSYPETLKRAYNEGHQIAVHTWSHGSMTSLSNEQIVAELMWTQKAIFDIIGVNPIYWRPPYGDVDARVRNIATQLGFKTSIWTQDFDTNDWNIPATATPATVVATFKSWLVKIPTMKTGFIVLEHDLLPAEVNVSLTGILPIAYATKGLTMEPIAQCLNDAKPYKEGAGTFKLLPGSGGGVNGTTGTNGTTGPTVVNGNGKNSTSAAGSAFATTTSSVLMAGVGLAITALISVC
ncbi:chitin deacetylase [Mortierella alpina]|uniref:Chitin deacetylase n=1 Tax=Mortierella alpina TaxID=64518 RepID=A0A9P6ITY9_MORAP|nr:chitin deacetylase [Mortierella alpina]